jgi:thymidylate kinase
MKLILEGCDLAGKSTAVKMLKDVVPIEDRLMPFTESIEPGKVNFGKIGKIVDETTSLFVVLVVSDERILHWRLSQRVSPDQYDMQCVDYNRQYRRVAEYLSDRENVEVIEVDGMNKYQKAAKIFEKYLIHKDRQGAADPK